MGDESAYVLQEKGLRLLYADNLLNIEKESATSIGKALLMPRLTERLARESAAKDVKIWDALLRIDLGNIPLEVFVVVGEQGLVCPMIEVVPVGLTRGRIPFARKDTLGALSIVESDVESTDSGEKIDELVGGLLGHNSPKHIHD